MNPRLPAIYTDLVKLTLDNNDELKRFPLKVEYETPQGRLSPFGTEGLNYHRLGNVSYYRGKNWWVETIVPLHQEEVATRHLRMVNRRIALRSEVQRVHTSCKDCCFARYDGDTQVDCSVGRLSKYKSQGVVLHARDDEKNFEIINSRVCNAFRPLGWKGDLAKETEVKLDAVVVVGPDSSVDSLQETLNSLVSQSLPPLSINIINNKGAIKPGELTELLKGTGLAWTLTHIVEPNATTERAIDLTVSKLKGQLYTVMEPGWIMPSDFVERVNFDINEKLSRWSVLRPRRSFNGLTVYRGFHLHPAVNGNKPVVYTDGDPPLSNILMKAERISYDNSMRYLVKDYRQLWPKTVS